jgi:adenylylsulfate kinase-like enzyme
MVEEFGRFVEVFVDAPLAECARRDVKGLYAKAFAGELPAFTGVSDPYERPRRPDLVLPTDGVEPAASSRRLLAQLAALGLVADEAAA